MSTASESPFFLMRHIYDYIYNRLDYGYHVCSRKAVHQEGDKRSKQVVSFRFLLCSPG